VISLLAPLALTASTGALLAVPLMPALRELRSKHDAGPLITRKDDGRIENFAVALRERCHSFARSRGRDVALHVSDEPKLVTCATVLGSSPETQHAASLPAEHVLYVAEAGLWQGPMRTEVLVICAGPTQLPDGFQALADFYSQNDMRCGRSNLFRALLGEARIVLGSGTQILRWIHAESDLVAEEHCTLFGRASAARSLTLAPECKFERIYAPVIYTSAAAGQIEIRGESAPFSKLAQAGLGRKRIHGETHLSAGEQHYGNVVTTKGLEMDEGACVFGSVKANGQIELNERAEVDGSLVSTKRIRIASGSFVKGPIISEREIIIDAGVQVGLPGVPTTISAPRIRIAPGSVLHGTVWARVEGRVGE
jgi:cytoskeletal protein CcmA (bactofilin family)